MTMPSFTLSAVTPWPSAVDCGAVPPADGVVLFGPGALLGLLLLPHAAGAMTNASAPRSATKEAVDAASLPAPAFGSPL